MKFKLSIMLLLFFTCILMAVPSYAVVIKDERVGDYYCYQVYAFGDNPLQTSPHWNFTGEPERYWNLTDPDPYILEAIKNPGRWSELCYFDNSTFWRDVWCYGTPTPSPPTPIEAVPFKYNGTYYDWGIANPSLVFRFVVLSEEPMVYENLTNPPWFILEAINNPGAMIAESIEYHAEMKRFFWNTGMVYKYNGTYYERQVFDVMCGGGRRLPWPRTEYVVAGVMGGTGITVTALVYLWKRRKKQPS